MGTEMVRCFEMVDRIETFYIDIEVLQKKKK